MARCLSTGEILSLKVPVHLTSQITGNDSNRFPMRSRKISVLFEYRCVCKYRRLQQVSSVFSTLQALCSSKRCSAFSMWSDLLSLLPV
jgi:hypothetical protein